MAADPQEIVLRGSYEANHYEQNYPILAKAIRFHAQAIISAAFLVMVGLIAAAGIIAGGLG